MNINEAIDDLCESKEAGIFLPETNEAVSVLLKAHWDMLKALEQIADITLWGERIEDENRRKDEASAGEYDLELDQYEPCCDVESTLLQDAVEAARAPLAKLAGPTGTA